MSSKVSVVQWCCMSAPSTCRPEAAYQIQLSGRLSAKWPVPEFAMLNGDLSIEICWRLSIKWWRQPELPPHLLPCWSFQLRPPLNGFFYAFRETPEACM